MCPWEDPFLGKVYKKAENLYINAFKTLCAEVPCEMFFSYSQGLHAPFQDSRVVVNFEKPICKQWTQNSRVDYRAKLRTPAKRQYNNPPSTDTSQDSQQMPETV